MTGESVFWMMAVARNGTVETSALFLDRDDALRDTAEMLIEPHSGAHLVECSIPADCLVAMLRSCKEVDAA